MTENQRKANEILMKELNRFIPIIDIPTKDTEQITDIATQKRMIMTLNQNVMKYGCCLSASTLNQLMSVKDKRDFQILWEDLEEALQDKMGIESFKDGRLTYYPNFPDEVMSKDEMELCVNSYIQYISRGLFGIDVQKDLVEEPKSRTSALDFRDHTYEIISFGTEQDLKDLMDDRIHSQSMSEEKEEDLQWFAKTYEKEFEHMATDGRTYQSKENLIKVAGIFYENGKTGYCEKMIHDTPDVLRMIAYISNQHMESNKNKISLAMQPKDFILNLNKDDKKMIKRMLNHCKNLYYDIWKQPDLWKKAMRYIGMKQNTPKRVRQVFTNLAKGNKVNEFGHDILSPNRQMEIMREKMQIFTKSEKYPDYINVDYMARNFPGLFIKELTNTVRNCSTTSDVEKVAKAVIDHCSEIPVIDLMKTYNAIQHENEDDMIYIKNRYDKVYAKEKTTKMIPNHYRSIILQAIDKAIEKNVSHTKEFGKVYIDDTLKNHVIPLREERDASYNASMTKYSQLPMNEDNLLMFGITWTDREVKAVVDMDLSLVAYDENMNRVDVLNYGNLKNSFGCHSGDYQHGKGFNEEEEGSIEMIFCDKTKMKEKGVAYLSPRINGFNSTLQKEIDLRFIMGSKDAELNYDDVGINTPPTFNGELVEYQDLHAPAIGVNGESREAYPCVIDVKNNKTIWLDEQADINSIFCNIHNEYSKKNAKARIEHALHQHYPTMYELFTHYAKHNGIIVDNIEEADTVFLAIQTKNGLDGEITLKDNAYVLCSNELDSISANFLSTQPKLDSGFDLVKDIGIMEEVQKPKEEKYYTWTLDEMIQKAQQDIEKAQNQLNQLIQKKDDILL